MAKFDKKGEIEVISHCKFLRTICAEKFLSIEVIWVNYWKIFKHYQEKMEATSSKVKRGSNTLIWGVEWKATILKLTPTIVETLDLSRAQSQIPPKVLLINDIRSHFKGSIQDIGTLEMDETLEKLCVNGMLKLEHQHLEAKRLTQIPHMPQDFQVKWIRYILSHVHNG